MVGPVTSQPVGDLEHYLLMSVSPARRTSVIGWIKWSTNKRRNSKSRENRENARRIRRQHKCESWQKRLQERTNVSPASLSGISSTCDTTIDVAVDRQE